MVTKVDVKDREKVSKELREAIGKGKVKDDEAVLVTYAFDQSLAPFSMPDYVVLPESTEDVRQCLMIANKYKTPVTVLSAGMNVAGNTVPIGHGILLDLRRMNKIIEINTDSGYAIVEPGVTFDEFIAALAQEGFRCQISTAPGGASPLAHHLGRPSGNFATRHLDSIIDLEVVYPDGTVMNTGSSHFPGVGYSMRYGPLPDLAGLLCCSYGALGIVTKASLRIYPINEANRLVQVAFDNYASSVKFVKEITNNNIPEHCIIWSWQNYTNFEIEGENHLKPPENVPYNIVTVHMSGYRESMELNSRLCENIAHKYGGKVLTPEESQRLATPNWKHLYQYYRTSHLAFGRKPGMGPFSKGKYMAWIVMAEPKDMVHVEKLAMSRMASLGVTPGYYSMPFDFGRSIFLRMFVFPDAKNKELISKVADTYKELFSEVMEKYRAHPYRARFGQTHLYKQTGGYYDILLRIKRAVDPNNILNPHVFGGE